MTIEDPTSVGAQASAPRRSRVMEAVIAVFVIGVAISILWPKGNALGVAADRVTEWIGLALMLLGVGVNAVTWAKRDRFWLPKYVHILAALGFAATGWSVWIDRERWSTSPLYYLGHLLLGPATVYVVFLAYDGVRQARVGQHTNSRHELSSGGQEPLSPRAPSRSRVSDPQA